MTCSEIIESIAGLSQFGMAVAVGVGVFIAYKQLDSWRDERIAVKKAEVGEDLISLVSELDTKIRSIRSPMGFGPPKGEDDDGTFDFVGRLRELADLDTEFTQLRQFKIRRRAFMDSNEVEAAIDVFFDARSKLYAGLNGMIRQIRGAKRYGEDFDERAAERVNRYEEVIWDGYADGDPIKEAIETAVTTIETQMVPLVRLEIAK